jgi:hypothetical protein
MRVLNSYLTVLVITLYSRPAGLFFRRYRQRPALTPQPVQHRHSSANFCCVSTVALETSMIITSLWSEICVQLLVFLALVAPVVQGQYNAERGDVTFQLDVDDQTTFTVHAGEDPWKVAHGLALASSHAVLDIRELVHKFHHSLEENPSEGDSGTSDVHFVSTVSTDKI